MKLIKAITIICLQEGQSSALHKLLLILGSESSGLIQVKRNAAKTGRVTSRDGIRTEHPYNVLFSTRSTHPISMAARAYKDLYVPQKSFAIDKLVLFQDTRQPYPTK